MERFYSHWPLPAAVRWGLGRIWPETAPARSPADLDRAINDAIRNGAQMHEVREFAGHSDIRTTELYFVRKEEDTPISSTRQLSKTNKGWILSRLCGLRYAYTFNYSQ